MKKIYPVVIFSLLFFSCISTDTDLPSAAPSSQTPQENLQVQPVEQTQEPQKEEYSELEQEQNQESQPDQEQFEQEKTENTLEDKVEADIFIEEQYPIEEKIPESELADDFTKLQKNIEYNFEEKIFIEEHRNEWENFFRKIYSKNKTMNYAEENAQIWKKEIVETIKEKIKTLTNTSGLKGNTFELFFANILNDIAEDLEVKQMGQEKFQFNGKSKGEFSVDIQLNYNDVNGIANTLGVQVKEGRSFLDGITDNKKIFTSTVYQEQNINGTFNSFMRFLDEQDWYVFADLLELKDLIQQKIDSYEKYFLMKMEAGQLRILTSNLYKVKSDSDIDIPIDSINSLYYLSGKIVTASLLLSSRFISLEDKDNELGYYIVDPVSTFLYISNKKSPENINTENLVKLMKKVKFKRITKG